MLNLVLINSLTIRANFTPATELFREPGPCTETYPVKYIALNYCASKSSW